MYSTHGGSVKLQDEDEVVWNEDPTQYPFLREWVIQTQKQRGLPQEYKNKSYSVIGYVNLTLDADRDHGSVFSKRIFVLLDTDLVEAFTSRKPAEAVDPHTVESSIEPTSI